jgi:predicted helicase
LFSTSSENGSNRHQNITDWARNEFRTHYNDPNITKWDIFHYVHAVLHHPAYRERYAANLKRELPRVPFVEEGTKSRSLAAKGAARDDIPKGSVDNKPFWALAEAGRRLAEIHVGYEQQPEYPLEEIENPNEKPSYRVQKMRLGRDKTSLMVNSFLTLSGIPPETFDYRLGNRCALEWVIDQYQVSTDKRSGITNDPNRDDDPQYIVRLVKQVVQVSVETVKIVKGLPGLLVEDAEA